MAEKLVLASFNAKKIRELREILQPAGYALVGLADYPGVEAPAEDGASFEENAVIKAEAALRATGLPALADDSGLVVDILGGDPGVRSARYAGEGAGDADNNRFLLANLAGKTGAERRARFVSVIALAAPGAEPLLFRGETSGVILDAPRGMNGFGYDPLFLSDDLGVTFAEAEGAAKHRVSHRGRALAALLAWLERRRDSADRG